MPCLRLHVPTLRAGDAARALERTLCAARGVYGAFAHDAERFVEIDFEDDEVTATELIGLIREAGYEARLAG